MQQSVACFKIRSDPCLNGALCRWMYSGAVLSCPLRFGGCVHSAMPCKTAFSHCPNIWCITRTSGVLFNSCRCTQCVFEVLVLFVELARCQVVVPLKRQAKEARKKVIFVTAGPLQGLDLHGYVTQISKQACIPTNESYCLRLRFPKNSIPTANGHFVKVILGSGHERHFARPPADPTVTLANTTSPNVILI